MFVSRSSGLPKPRGSGLSVSSVDKSGGVTTTASLTTRVEPLDSGNRAGREPRSPFHGGFPLPPSLLALAPLAAAGAARAPAASFAATGPALPRGHLLRPPLGQEHPEAAASDRGLPNSGARAPQEKRRRGTGREADRCGTHRVPRPPPKEDGPTHTVVIYHLPTWVWSPTGSGEQAVVHD